MQLFSLDMLGNLVYLRTTESCKKRDDERILVQHAVKFWLYRMISAYILLMLCNIFGSRHHQTKRNQYGFALFVYCWITTPIWQIAKIFVSILNQNDFVDN